MKKLLLLLVLCTGIVYADEAPSSDMMLVILTGQSNMSGRGFITEEDKVPIPNVYTLNKEGKWVPSVEPTHFERKTCGTCLGRTFARKLHEKYPDRVIGIVPCAVGGSPVQTWLPGVLFKHRSGSKEHPYDDALKRIRIAQKNGKIAAVLWHQGCSNSQGKKEFKKAEEEYRTLLLQVIHQFRSDVPELKNIPFIMGHLVSFRPGMKIDHVNTAIDAIVKVEPFTAAVSAEGITANPDKLHYNRKSLILFGERYFEVYEKMTSVR